MPRRFRFLRFRAAPPLAAALLASACAGPRHPPTAPGPAPGCGGACTERVGITFLGVGGFLVRYGDDAVLTAPHFTRPGAHRVGLNLPARPDTARIDAGMALLGPDALGDVRAVLVGHGHYDHLMDVPDVVRRHLPDPRVKVYGNDAALATLAYDTALRGRVVGVEGGLGNHLRRGRWFAPEGTDRVRFMALASEHAPHLLRRVYFLPPRPARVRATAPERPWEWVQGQPLAFLVDFLGPDGRVVFRIHYQDSASEPPLGLPPPLRGADAAPVDVAILCGASFSQVSGYPDTLLERLQPRHAVIGHWDDFFLGTGGKVPGTNLGRLGRRIDRALGPGRRWQPQVGETRWFCVCPRDGSSPAASPGR